MWQLREDLNITDQLTWSKVHVICSVLNYQYGTTRRLKRKLQYTLNLNCCVLQQNLIGSKATGSSERMIGRQK